MCSIEQIQLIDFINILEKNLNKKAQINFLSKQLGDVNDNSGNSNFIKDKVGWMPKVNFEKGIKEFISWYKTYYDLV